MSEAFEDELFSFAAHFHDLGKCTDSFQSYIQGQSKSSEPHALVSALGFFANSQMESKQKLFISNAIACHHTPIKNPNWLLHLFFRQRGPQWQLIMKQYEELLGKEDVQSYWDLEKIDDEEIEDMADELMDMEYSIEDFIQQKLLYSRLIYADKYEAIFGTAPAQKPFGYTLAELEAYEKKMGFDPASYRSRFSKELLDRYFKNKNEPIYTITAPTGAGKTLASLKLALTIAQEERKSRIVYAIPFTSIIDQSVAIFDQIFAQGVTPHHYRVTFETDEESHNDYDRIKFLTVSWSEQFIVTTFYQLFFALLGSANSDNVKLQSLQNSVLVLDEVQGIPFELWQGLKPLFEALAHRLDLKVIFMSATMPILTRNATELAPKKELFARNDRYRITWIHIDDRSDLAQKILEETQKGRSVLCVVNTIKNAKLLYKELQNHIDELYCLNSYMMPTDRSRVIEALKEPGSNQVVGKVLISTQVVEAGVDLDFDIGFREIAPLSSIIQTAGRVNREGKKTKSPLYVFDTLDHEIYDSVLMLLTKEQIQGQNIDERDILEFSQSFFSALDRRVADRFDIKNCMESLDFEEVDKGLKKAFGLENRFTQSVVLGVNLRELERKYFDFCTTSHDPWEHKSYKERLFKSLLDNIVSIKEKDLDRSGVNFDKSEVFGLVYLPSTEGVYSHESGFLIEEEKDGLFEI